MRRLGQPLVPLYCIGGISIDDAWMAELAKLEIPKRKRGGRIPFSADLRWWFCEKHHDGTLLEDVKGIDLSKIFPNGVQPAVPQRPFDPVPGVQVEETWSGAPVIYRNGGYPGSVHSIALHTPAGSLTATERYADRSFGVVEHAVKRAEDLAIVRAVFARRAEAARTGGDDDPRYMPKTPFQSFLIEWAGVENAAYIHADAPEEVEKTVEFVECLYEPMIERLARPGAWVYSCENLSSDVSASYWDAYVGPQLARRVQRAASHGANWGIHLDGKVMPLLGRLSEVGVKHADGLTATPSGDLDPLKFREAAGPGIRLRDILPQIIFVPAAFPEDEFMAYIRRVVEFYMDDGNVVLGIGDMLPVNGSLKRVERVIDMIEELT